MTSDYEARRLKNLEDNKRVLRELGLLNPFQPLPKVLQRPRPRPKPQPQQKRKRESEGAEHTPSKAFKVDDTHGSVFSPGQRRRSSRIKGDSPATKKEIDVEVEKELKEEEEEDDCGRRYIKIPPNRPNIIGAVPDVEVGTWWATRMEASAAAIHRPWVAGIHGGEDGCYSLALSGGYEDDIDMGECFTYTGEGGRDLKGTRSNPKNLRTAAQSKDQALTRGNLALTRSVETGNPVRVLRGYKLHGPFAPDEGYRYDGIYKVEKYWYTVGLSGFGVYKFALKRIAEQGPPPWEFACANSCQDSGVGSEVGSECPADTLSEIGSDGKPDAQNEDESKMNGGSEEQKDNSEKQKKKNKKNKKKEAVTVESEEKPTVVKDEPKEKKTNKTKDAELETDGEVKTEKESDLTEKEENIETKDTDKEATVVEAEVKIEESKDEPNGQDSGIGSQPESQSSQPEALTSPKASTKKLTKGTPKGLKDIRSFFGKSPKSEVSKSPDTGKDASPER